MITKFPPKVADELRSYVYRLIDPRNGETFYVGKGKENRILDHCNPKKMDTLEDGLDSNKLKRIREIQALGLEVGHVIHRHGMDEQTAFEVEAALIDAYPGLTNVVNGSGSNARGSMHLAEVLLRYHAQVADFQDNLMLITINRTIADRSIYEAVRYAWKVSLTNARKAKYVLAVDRGLIVGAFYKCRWMAASAENFPDRGDDREGRFGFVGKEAPADVLGRYVGKRVPDEYRRPGAANPVRYVRVGKDGQATAVQELALAT